MIDEKGNAQWYDLPNTKEDAMVAMHIAHGFGIEDKDIIYIEDWTEEEIDKVISEIKHELRIQSG